MHGALVAKNYSTALDYCNKSKILKCTNVHIWILFYFILFIFSFEV